MAFTAKGARRCDGAKILLQLEALEPKGHSAGSGLLGFHLWVNRVNVNKNGSNGLYETYGGLIGSNGISMGFALW